MVPVRLLRDPDERSRRKAMLRAPHMAPLTDAVTGLRQHGDAPDFDPMDGGANAQALFLLEKPGPTTLGSSGLVSRDNDNATAEAIALFSVEAGFDRRRTVLWNTVPWWNGTVKVTGREIASGLAALPAVLACLPHLRVAVLVGRTAGRAAPLLAAHDLSLFSSAHPSPNVRAGYPALWRAIPERWREARACLDGLPPAEQETITPPCGPKIS